MHPKSRSNSWLPLILGVCVAAGMFIGFKMRDGMRGNHFFKSGKSNPVPELLELVKRHYVDEVNPETLTDTAIQAVLAGLDPHSVFIPSEDLEDINEEIQGSFSGIGVEFNMIQDTMHVMYAFPEGPASRAGLQMGDQLLEANGRKIAGQKLPADSIRRILKGPAGSSVKVTIRRNQQPIQKEIIRGEIPVSSVDAAYMADKQTGYIRLNIFSARTYREFMLKLDSLKKAGMTQLILDLRDNGGGVMDEAVEIADEFLSGDKLITYTEGRSAPRKEYRCRRQGLFEEGKLVVLSNEGSASASEIIMGALQDWDRATIIGRRSFGKGLVQEQFNLNDGSAVRLTVARYFTPSGRSIQRPYEAGEDAYYNEVYQRNATDEKNPGSDTGKIYRTKSGRPVYGGGGIRPDILVNSDTNRLGLAMMQVLSDGLINLAAYRVLQNQPSITRLYKNPAHFAADFQFSISDQQIIRQITAKADSTGTIWSDNDLAYIQQAVKVSMARLLWRNEGLFQVSSKSDSTFIKARDWFNQ